MPSSARARRLAVLATGLLIGGTAVAFGPPTAASAVVADPASVVNPFIGTSHGGNTFPGADAPFGMVQWSPDTTSRPSGGGYNYSDSTITAFSLTHLSGPGCSANSDIGVLPTTGAVNGTDTATFTHTNESANAGSYKVGLGNGVTTELTATTRSGMARFTFPATTQANLILRLTNGTGTDGTFTFTAVSSSEVSGSVTGGHFCGRPTTHRLYFDMVFDHPFTSSGGFTGGRSLTFDTTSATTLQAKVGLSFVSTGNAAANRAAENPNWNLSSTQSATHNAWNSLLGKVQIGGGTAAQQQVFYTSLYHSLLHPNVVSDTNGQYFGFDNQVHGVSGGHSAQYANYSGWDIYRAQAQLEALVAPAQASDSAQSMLNDYNQAGVWPRWSENNGETYVMIGDPADPIIASYYAFGARNFDTTAALTGLVHEATTVNNDRPGNNYLYTYGYQPADGSYTCCNYHSAASTTLEYGTADFAISAFAGALGDTATQAQFANRAQDWRNTFNPSSGFMQQRLADGSWPSGFNPATSDGFIEGTSWQYTGMVPFNIGGLAAAMGGDAAMQAYLDNVLSNGLKGGGGKANLGNEPSIELPWEYDYVGRPYKTQQIVRQVQDQFWPDDPANWAVGNDDLGTMSAWYVWSAMGFFPETPGTADLALGSPLFTSVKVSLGGGGTINVSAPAAADNAPYVQSATLNGTAWNNAYLPPSFATNGGTLNLTLGTSANTGWASASASAPPSYNGGGTSQPGWNGTDPAGLLASGVSGLCADVTGSATANGTKVQLWNCNHTGAQQWTATVYQQLQALGKCLDVNHSGTTNGTIVQLWSCNGTGAQRWVANSSTKELVNPESNRCLTGSARGAQLTIQDCTGAAGQQWTVPAPGPITSGIAGKCADDSSSGTVNGNPIGLYSCNGSSSQQWMVGNDGRLIVRNSCLDVAGGGTANGTLVQLYQCTGTAQQQWTYNATTHALTNRLSGRCLEDPNASTTNGTRLQVADCNGSTAQQWTLPDA